MSIVTPVLDEEEELPSRARELDAQEPPWEWIVADGGAEAPLIGAAQCAVRSAAAHVAHVSGEVDQT